MDSFKEVRFDLARKSKWNIGFFWSGLIFWIFVLVVGNVLPLSTAKYAWLIAGFSIVPLAIPFSRFYGADAFPKNNTLADLTGKTHATVTTFGFPIVLVSLILYPEAQILVMSILNCIDFYVFGWAFGSRIFVVGASIRVIGSTAIWFLLPEYRLTLLPSFVALSYLAFIIAIPVYRAKWEQEIESAHGA